jgi:two-component system cell cycle sensor histidine kinase/response regulator CckA
MERGGYGQVQPLYSVEAPNPMDQKPAKTILLVEDDVTTLLVLRRMLERLGYRVLIAEDGAKALKVYEEHGDKIDLLLTDVVMPGLSGPKLAERVRLSRPQIPVLFISGFVDQGSAVGDMLTGAAFLSKPIAEDRLAKKIGELVTSQLGA